MLYLKFLQDFKNNCSKGTVFIERYEYLRQS